MIPVLLTALPALTQIEPFQRCNCTEKLSLEEKSLPLVNSKRMLLPAVIASVALLKTDEPSPS
ncbi:hypothetical protein D3C73_1510540 [compost metagenome]